MPELTRARLGIARAVRTLLIVALSAATVAASAIPALASFNPALNTPAGTTPAAVATGDFNGDSRLDLAVADQGSNRVTILFRNASGGLSSGPSYTVGTAPASL